MTSSGTRQRQYTAAVVFGVLAMVCALLAPALTRLMLATPTEFILALGGIAMLRALQQAFVTAFSTTFTLRSLVTFVVTMSGMSLFNIHPAFWGLVEHADHAGHDARLKTGTSAPHLKASAN